MTRRIMLTACLLFVIIITAIILLRNKSSRGVITAEQRVKPSIEQISNNKRLVHFAGLAQSYAARNRYSTKVCFLIDMGLHSGKNRFFVYDLRSKKPIKSGLVAHGSCNTSYQLTAQFSNEPNCGCSSLGRYKVSYSYNGQFGKAYKLYGLDSTNNNAFRRFVVLHGYQCVPNEETYPAPICNSLGCPMVSNKFLKELSAVISEEKKPILLWMFR